MAIGDRVQAGLGRMDFSAFQRAGDAQARANQAFIRLVRSSRILFSENLGNSQREKEAKVVAKIFLMPPDLLNSMAKNFTH